MSGKPVVSNVFNSNIQHPFEKRKLPNTPLTTQWSCKNQTEDKRNILR